MTIYRRSDPIPIEGPVAASEARGRNLKRDDLHRAAARVIYETIASDGYPEGSVIPKESDLVVQLGISRTALREAIKGLVSKGLLQTRRRAGTIVRDRSEWNLLDSDIMEWTRGYATFAAITAELAPILAVIEPFAAEQAALAHTAASLQVIERALARLRVDWGDPGGRPGAIVAFHRAIAAASGNRYVLSIVNSIYGDLLRNDAAYLTARAAGLSADTYGALVAAISARDGIASPRLMRGLLREATTAPPISASS